MTYKFTGVAKEKAPRNKEATGQTPCRRKIEIRTGDEKLKLVETTNNAKMIILRKKKLNFVDR